LAAPTPVDQGDRTGRPYRATVRASHMRVGFVSRVTTGEFEADLRRALDRL
jgi:hypothetical protein